MKIFFVTPQQRTGNNSGELTFDIHSDACCRVRADSTLLSGGRPFFVPTFTTDCRLCVGLVVRISRLGKTIARRWARRYYDAVTVGAAFVARDVEQSLAARGLATDLAHNFDGATTVGRFEALPAEGIGALAYSLSMDGREVVSAQGTAIDVDVLIEQLSAICQMRQGDYLFVATPHDEVAVHEDMHIVGRLNDRPVLEFNIK